MDSFSTCPHELVRTHHSFSSEKWFWGMPWVPWLDPCLQVFLVEKHTESKGMHKPWDIKRIGHGMKVSLQIGIYIYMLVLGRDQKLR